MDRASVSGPGSLDRRTKLARRATLRRNDPGGPVTVALVHDATKEEERAFRRGRRDVNMDRDREVPDDAAIVADQPQVEPDLRVSGAGGSGHLDAEKSGSESKPGGDVATLADEGAIEAPDVEEVPTGRHGERERRARGPL